ncbi:hypothetical protein KCU99_g253, partial [Aureobasidium melanogenum]
MTSFRSLPLELRNIIYDYALEDDHDIFTDGLPTLFSVCPHITGEIYSYRSIVTTVVITNETPEPYEESAKPMLSRYVDAIAEFTQKSCIKELVVRFKPVARPTTAAPDTDTIADHVRVMATRLNHYPVMRKADSYSIRLNLAYLEASLFEWQPLQRQQRVQRPEEPTKLCENTPWSFDYKLLSEVEAALDSTTVSLLDMFVQRRTRSSTLGRSWVNCVSVTFSSHPGLPGEMPRNFARKSSRSMFIVLSPCPLTVSMSSHIDTTSRELQEFDAKKPVSPTGESRDDITGSAFEVAPSSIGCTADELDEVRSGPTLWFKQREQLVVLKSQSRYVSLIFSRLLRKRSTFDSRLEIRQHFFDRVEKILTLVDYVFREFFGIVGHGYPAGRVLQRSVQSFEDLDCKFDVNGDGENASFRIQSRVSILLETLSKLYPKTRKTCDRNRNRERVAHSQKYSRLS